VLVGGAAGAGACPCLCKDFTSPPIRRIRHGLPALDCGPADRPAILSDQDIHLPAQGRPRLDSGQCWSRCMDELEPNGVLGLDGVELIRIKQPRSHHITTVSGHHRQPDGPLLAERLRQKEPCCVSGNQACTADGGSRPAVVEAGADCGSARGP